MLLLPKGSRGRSAHPRAAHGDRRFAIALAAFVQHRTGEMLTVTDMPWIPSLGIRYHLAADGISLALVLLTGIVAITGILFSWNIEERTKEFFAFYLLLIGARLRRLPQLRSVPPLRLLRNRHHPQVLPHRHLGFDAPRVRRHEARYSTPSSAARWSWSV